ncbi:hypothetical protein DY000_02020602 [Brassica cretica]|uniref:Uncharacterized protein n=1 Tax=Brassica cretica TaxID=69181 RepID=A0ABQ7EEF2_BRACR|nr:hypothetical protein DY000_02020602 [Brassica cretica]
MYPRMGYLQDSLKRFRNLNSTNPPHGTEAIAWFVMMGSDRDNGVGTFPVADTCSIGSVWTLGCSKPRVAQFAELGLG